MEAMDLQSLGCPAGLMELLSPACGATGTSSLGLENIIWEPENSNHFKACSETIQLGLRFFSAAVLQYGTEVHPAFFASFPYLANDGAGCA